LISLQPGAVFSSAPIVYVAHHDTAPPPSQIVKTDPTSTLIRSLQSRKPQAENIRKKQAAKDKDKGKRPADSDLPSSSRAQKRGSGATKTTTDATVANNNRTTAGGTALDSTAPGPSRASKAVLSSSTTTITTTTNNNRGSVGIPEPSQGNYSKLGLQTKTIRELQGILKAWGLAVSGKKDDLIMRILDQQHSKQIK
jgi:hypothetical protein